MTEKNEVLDSDKYGGQKIKEENRYFQQVTVTRVRGDCPYLHIEKNH